MYMEADLSKKLALLSGLVLLSSGVWGQNCDVANTCLFFGIGRHTIIASDTSLTQNFRLTCTGELLYSEVLSIKWLFTTNLSTPRLLDVDGDPKLSAKGSNLEFRNVTGAYEGIYYCQAEYTNGGLSDPQGAGRVHVAGRAFYKCPETTTAGTGDCETSTDLQAEVGESVDFDARIEFRHGGTCGTKQNVRLMFLDKIGDSNSLFICSNLGSIGRHPICANRSRVSVSFQGTAKYDIKLRLHDLTAADSGHYQVKVDLDDFVGGRRSSILKNFQLTVQDVAVVGGAIGGAIVAALLIGVVIAVLSVVVLVKRRQKIYGRMVVENVTYDGDSGPPT